MVRECISFCTVVLEVYVWFFQLLCCFCMLRLMNFTRHKFPIINILGVSTICKLS